MNNDDQRYKKVMISGSFSVGKSILLQHTAIQLNQKLAYKEKIMFVVEKDFGYKEIRSMQYHRLKIDLEEKHGKLTLKRNMVYLSKIIEGYAAINYNFEYSFSITRRNFH